MKTLRYGRRSHGRSPPRRALPRGCAADRAPLPRKRERAKKATWAPSPACGGGPGWGLFGAVTLSSSSPSLPRRDDLDLVAVLDRRLRPLTARQHVVIQRDREMRALIFQFAEQRIDA